MKNKFWPALFFALLSLALSFLLPNERNGWVMAVCWASGYAAATAVALWMVALKETASTKVEEEQ